MPFSSNRQSRSGGSSRSSSSGSSRGFGSYTTKRVAKEEQERINTNTAGSGQYDMDSTNKQIANARTRLEHAGVNVDTDTDKRNWFEKATNLPQGQNWLFDTLDLIGRPGQAALGALQNYSNSTGNYLDAAKKGFTGQERYRGSTIAKNAGWTGDSKLGQFVAGTALEILTDPVNLIPGAAFAKAGKLVGAGVKGSAKLAYNTAEKAPGFARLSESTIRPAAAAVKDGLGYTFNKNYRINDTLSGKQNGFLQRTLRQNENSRKYLQEESLKNTMNAAKMAGGVNAGRDVGRIMEAPLKQFDDVQVYELPSGEQITSKREIRNRIQSKRAENADLGKSIANKEFVQRNVLNLSEGDMAHVLNDSGKRAKNSKPQMIEDVRVINGEKQFKLSGQADYLPSKRVSPKMQERLTEVGEITQKISAISRNIDKNDRALRRMFMGVENKKLKGLQRTDPASLTQKKINRRFLPNSPALNLLIQQGDEIKAQIDGARKELGLPKVRKKSYTPEQMQKLATDRTFKSLSPSPAFNLLLKNKEEFKTELDQLRNQKDVIKQGNIEKIKANESDIKDYRASLENPLIAQRESARKVRELSPDENIRKAANLLTSQNNLVREIAKQKGIDIPELEGYMRHVLSKAEREARKHKAPAAIDQGRMGTGNPSKKILTKRELHGSAEDINDRIGRDFFETNAFFASGIGQKQLIDYIHAVDLRRKVLSHPDFARKFKEGEQLRKGEVLIDSNNYKFIKDTEPTRGFAAKSDQVGGQYVVTPQVKMILDRYNHLTTDEGTKAVMNAYDSVLNNWKKLALLSPLYHVRNLGGAMFNNYIAGMNPAQLIRNTTDGLREVVNASRGKESALFNAYRRQGLGSEALSNVEFLRSVDPEKQIQKQIERGSKRGLAKVGSKVGNLTETSREAGTFIDQASRFALFKHEISKGKTPAQAANRVREVQFDYTDLSNVEQKGFKRVVPFYAWSRNNIPFQLKSLFSDPRKYQHVNQLRLNAQDTLGLDEESTPSYMKENFAIPLIGDPNTGTGKYLGLNLPIGDLTKISKPLKLVTDSIATPAKLVPELSLNRSFFNDKPIQSYAGQKTNYNLPGNPLDFGINPKVAYALEQLLGQPGRFASNLAKDKEDIDQSKAALSAVLGISSPLKDYDVAKNKYYKSRDELKKLQDYIKYIEDQEGVDVKTLAEIKKALKLQ